MLVASPSSWYSNSPENWKESIDSSLIKSHNLTPCFSSSSSSSSDQHFNGRRTAHFFAFSSQLMCFSKTVLYFLTEILSGFEYTKHNDTQTFWLLFAIPSGVWLVFSLLVVVLCGKSILNALSSSQPAQAKKKQSQPQPQPQQPQKKKGQQQQQQQSKKQK